MRRSFWNRKSTLFHRKRSHSPRKALTILIKVLSKWITICLTSLKLQFKIKNLIRVHRKRLVILKNQQKLLIFSTKVMNRLKVTDKPSLSKSKSLRKNLRNLNSLMFKILRVLSFRNRQKFMKKTSNKVHCLTYTVNNLSLSSLINHKKLI